MAEAQTTYKYCFDGTVQSQKIINAWDYLDPYIKKKYTDSSSLVRTATLYVEADIASFSYNYSKSFDLSYSDATRTSYGTLLSVAVNRLISNLTLLQNQLPKSTDSTDTVEDANMRYSITSLLTELNDLKTKLPVACA